MSVAESARSPPLTRSGTSTTFTSSPSTPFHHQPNYITLTRTLSRLCDTLLPLPAAPISSLTAYQQDIRTLLLSPHPYQRTKYQRTIDNARASLLDLERGAQTIKVQRTKREILKDLAEKRRMIRELRNAVEELGRQAERRNQDEQPPLGRGPDAHGETVEELLGLPRRAEDYPNYNSRAESESKPKPPAEPSPSSPTSAPTQLHPTLSSAQTTSSDRSALLNLRNRKPAPSTTEHPSSPSPSSTPAPPGPGLTPFQETLTHSLLTLSRQLKSQSLTLSQTLQTTDAAHVSHATTALDRSTQLLEVAGRGMGRLKRMSEGEGWWGRIMLYAWIVGLWVLLLGLVGVGPKLRF